MFTPKKTLGVLVSWWLIPVALTPSALAAEAPLDKVELNPKTFRGTEGFFRVGQDTQSRYWLITPDNKPFYYRGVTSINREGTTGGRRAKPGPYFDSASTLYKTKKDFATAQVRRLREWNFNALGAWCTEEFYDLEVDGSPMPYTEILEFAYVGPQIVGDGIWLPDVFDPKWENAADLWAKKICTPRKNSKALIGYFTDNELGWAQPKAEDLAQQADPNAVKKPGQMTLLQHALTLPPESGTFKTAWTFVTKKYNNDLKALSKAWDVQITDSASIRKLNPNYTHIVVGDGTIHPNKILAEKLNPNPEPRPRNAPPKPAPKRIETPDFYKDQEAFSKLFAEQYFRRSAQAIRKSDPNHLILGARFGGPPGDVILAAMNKDWVDVCSANNYRFNFSERMDIYYKGSGLPVLNGEFAYHSGEFSIRQKTPEGMAQMGARSLEELFTHPAVVGYTWYRWVQGGPPEEPGRGVSCGLVHTNDKPRETHIKTLTESNAKADTIAAQRKSP